jgi:hypothetical protein
MDVVNEAVVLAEEMTSNFYKYSTSQWRRSRYDIRTLKDLVAEEITDHAFAQILRYVAPPVEIEGDISMRGLDYYKICLQDHVILGALERDPTLALFPLVLYVVTHELVHVVRFSRFERSFDAFPTQRREEEVLVHRITSEILREVPIDGVKRVSDAYQEALLIEGVLLDKLTDAASQS